jgi:hypothetical protein
VKAKTELLLTMCCLPLGIFAQMPTVIPLASEPHHHLALHNEYVNVYEVEVAPHETSRACGNNDGTDKVTAATCSLVAR